MRMLAVLREAMLSERARALVRLAASARVEFPARELARVAVLGVILDAVDVLVALATARNRTDERSLGVDSVG